MPAKKKARTNHHGQSGQLSQAEIWDDSALVRSWNDAVAEYEFYHSIHARGENVDEILRQAEAGELDEERGPKQRPSRSDWQPVHAGLEATNELDGAHEPINGTAQIEKEPDEDGEVQEDGEIPDSEADHQSALLENIAKKHEGLLTSTSDVPETGPNIPKNYTSSNSQAPVHSSHDQTLENIKMAYYWAGYYSGLHDGQRGTQPEDARATK